jgi:hypothetical protein
VVDAFPSGETGEGREHETRIRRYSPIVVNTQKQLQQAFEELKEGTFLKTEQK